jgi:SAM-dependent methyltransferase
MPASRADQVASLSDAAGGRTPYDRVPYRGTVVTITSPDHLNVTASWLSGASLRQGPWRVVELGCGSGANIVPLAFYNPRSSFVGIDRSETALDLAQSAVRRLGIRNLVFVLGDVRGLSDVECGPCTHVVAHGLFSWIEEDARRAVLRFCAETLEASGLAYVSYNAQPGWAIRRLVREMLLRAPAVQNAAIEQKGERAVAVAARLLAALPPRTYASSALLSEELERVQGSDPSYVFHEYLAETNEGFWLRDVVDWARAAGLAYIGDAQHCRPEGQMRNGPPFGKRPPQSVEDEEFFDVVVHRYFHASIFSPDKAARNRIACDALIREARIATGLRAHSDPFDLAEGSSETFASAGGVEITLDSSITKAAVVTLAAGWPRGMTFASLYRAASQLLEQHAFPIAADADKRLSEEVAVLFESGQIDLRLVEPHFAISVPFHPQAHRLALFEAEQNSALTTPYHSRLPMGTRELAMVRSLDGSRSRGELADMFGDQFADETLAVLARWGLLAHDGWPS